ncbi:MAG: hypothetical protein SGPRY_014405 [Prymnesium sp.]
MQRCRVSRTNPEASAVLSSVTCDEPKTLGCRLRGTGRICSFKDLYFSAHHGWLFLDNGTYQSPASQRAFETYLWPTVAQRHSTHAADSDMWKPRVVSMQEFVSLCPHGEDHCVGQVVKPTTLVSQLFHREWGHALLENAYHLYMLAESAFRAHVRPSKLAVFFDGAWSSNSYNRNTSITKDGEISDPVLVRLADAFFSPEMCRAYALHAESSELGVRAHSRLGTPITRFSHVLVGGFERHLLWSRRVVGQPRKAFFQCEPEFKDTERAVTLQRFARYIVTQEAETINEPSSKPLTLLVNSHGVLANVASLIPALAEAVSSWSEVREIAAADVMPLHQLLPLLRDCAVAVAPHGPLLANMIWMPKTSVMIEVVRQEDANANYNYIAMLAGVIHIAIVSLPQDSAPTGILRALEANVSQVISIAHLARRSTIEEHLPPERIATLESWRTWDKRRDRRQRMTRK